MSCSCSTIREQMSTALTTKSSCSSRCKRRRTLSKQKRKRSSLKHPKWSSLSSIEPCSRRLKSSLLKIKTHKRLQGARSLSRPSPIQTILVKTITIITITTIKTFTTALMGFFQLPIGKHPKTRILRMPPSPLSWIPCKRRVKSTHCTEEAWLSSYHDAPITSYKQLKSNSDTTWASARVAGNTETSQRVDHQVAHSPKAPWHAQQASPRPATTSRRLSRSQESKRSSLANKRLTSNGGHSRTSRFSITRTFLKSKTCELWKNIRTSRTILRLRRVPVSRRSTALKMPTTSDTRPSRTLARSQCLRFVTRIIQRN